MKKSVTFVSAALLACSASLAGAQASTERIASAALLLVRAPQHYSH
jgi:hypothetical protein